MITSLFAFVVATAISALLTPWIRQFALRRGLLDRVTSERKIHVGHIPRLGGVAIVAGFFASLGSVAVVRSAVGTVLFDSRHHWATLLTCGFLVAMLGFYDDLKGADAKTKFVVQFGIASLMYYAGFRIHNIALPFGLQVSLGVLALPATVLWIVGVTNAVNLVDGLDGLAGGVAFICLIPIFAISALRDEAFMMLMAAGLSGAVVGFLFYNLNPATIFMGDGGSMFLGFLLATSAINASQKASMAVSIAIPVVLLAFPIADTLLAIIRRAVRRRALFTGDREHIHHRLLASGISHANAVTALYLFCAISALASFTLYVAGSARDVVVALTCLFIAIGLLSSRVRRGASKLAIEVRTLETATIAPHFAPTANGNDQPARQSVTSHIASTASGRRNFSPVDQ